MKKKKKKKKSRQPRLPTYQHHKSSGRAFTVIEGQWIYLGKWGTDESHTAFRRVVAEYLATGRPPAPALAQRQSDRPSYTVADLCADFLVSPASRYEKNGKETSERKKIRLAVKLLDLYGDVEADEFGPRALAAVRSILVSKGCCRNYINEMTHRIRRIFKWGVKEELIPAHLFEGLRAVEGLRRGSTEAVESDPVLPVAWKNVEAALPHMPKPIAAMVLVQWYTGMRPGEVRQMRMRNLDMTGTTVEIEERQVPIWVYTPDSHKTEHHGRTRQIRIGPNAQEVLRPFLKLDPEAFLFSPRRNTSSHRAVRIALSCRRNSG